VKDDAAIGEFMFSKVAVTAALLVAMSAPALPAQITTARSTGPQVAMQCANVEMSARVNPACATALEGALSTEPLRADLLTAARSGDQRALKAVLVKAGLTAGQLETAKVLVKNQGETARVKDITIEISCCPLNITIIIRL
jgi:hypothetical protein